jgi:hypothetical protein
MNERIRELIEQATESTGFLTAGDSVKPLPVREFNKEKFAELIVRECIEQIEVFNVRMDARPRHIVEAIKSHFGVEQ